MKRQPEVMWRAALAVGVALAIATPARAEETVTASLSWVRLPGSEGCIAAQALARAVEDQLHKSVFVSPSVAGLMIEGRIEPKPAGGWVATVHTTRADGTDLGIRTLETKPEESCRDIDDELALVLALTIDPDAIARRREPAAPAPSPSVPPPPPSPPRVIVRTERVLVPVQREVATPEEPTTGEARGAAMVSAGVLPGAAFGVLVSGQVDVPALWPLELTGYGWFEQEAELDQGGASFSMFAGSMSVCPTMDLTHTFRGTACAGLSAGALRARGFGFDHVDEGTKPVIAVVSSLRVGWGFYGPMFASAGAGVHAAVVRPRYLLAEPDGSTRDVYQMSAVGVIGEFGIGMRFGP